MGTLCRIDGLSKGATFELVTVTDKARAEIINQVQALRRRVYADVYPEVKGIENDPHDESACVIYTQDTQGQVTSTARIAFDGPRGIPEAVLAAERVAHYHATGTQFAELGRFVIDDGARGVLANYYRVFYELGCAWGVDLYLMFVPVNKIELYHRLMDSEVVLRFQGLTFGSDHEYVCVEWWLRRTRPKFFSWCGAQPAISL